MMPTLVYVLTVSSAVHLANYYRDASGGRSTKGRTARAGTTPSVLSAATTAVGLGSLAISEVMPVRMFGIYSAGVLITLRHIPGGRR